MKPLVDKINGKALVLGMLALVVAVSAIGVVYTKHLNRKYFTELQKLEKHRDEMNIEWGQLQLEKSTFATSSEIEKAAREKLGMKQPPLNEIIMVKP